MDYTNPRSIYKLYDNSYSLNDTHTSTMQSSHSIPITLTSVKNPSDRRHLVINAGERVTIGRASRSEAKDLHASPDNALFDCPVVSREHAELKAHPFRAAEEQVTITDRESMHGTSVNGKRLAPYVPFSLASGDLIKFGEKVVRGSDTHDGVIVTFDRSATTTMPYSSRPIPSSRGYQVPSESENDSDDGSDGDSVMSHREHITSSANTTPEQTKSALGTQAQPIDIETDHVSLKEIIDIDDDFAPRSTQEPAAEVKAVQDTYAESEAAESVHDESEHDEEESEGGDAAEDLDNLSDSDASDLSNHYDESGEISEAEGPEMMSSKKAASPELGTPEEATKPQEHAFWRPYPKPSAPAYAPYPQYPPGAARANNFAMSRPPYDPIRGSYPATAIHQDFLSSRYPPPPVPARASSTYTYGYPGTLGGPLPTKSTTDSYDSSRWDVPPRTSSLPQANISQPYYSAMDYTTSATPAFTYIPNPQREAAKDSYGYGSQHTSSFVSSTAEPLKTASKATAEHEIDTQGAEIKARISIPAITDTTTSNLSVVDEARSTVEEAQSPSAETVSAASTKRKADAISDTTLEVSSEWTELQTFYDNDMLSALAQRPAPKKTRTIKSVGAHMVKFAIPFLAGSAGMAIFLASPLAQQLLEA
ncbi:hypothetical protein LTR85_010156 [Meristemomyces frigidus]|nr:hypothetical protein LTR85_010156 [Meristemomyces frigidus]